MNPNAQEWDPANPYTASSNNPSRGNPNANTVNTSASYYPQQQQQHQQQNYQEQYMRQLQEQQYAQQQYAQQLAQQREYYYREEQRRQQQQQQQQYQHQQRQQYQQQQQPQPQQQQQPRQQYQQPQQQQQGGSYYTYNNNNQSQSSNWNTSSSSSSQSRPQQGGGRGRGRGGYQNEYRNNEYDRNNNAPYGGGRNRDQDRDNVGVYQQQQQKQPYQERQQYHQQHYQQQQPSQQQQHNNKNNSSQNQSNNNNTKPVSKNYDTNTDDNFGSNTERNSGEAFDSMDAAEVVKTNSQPKAPQDFDDNSDVEDANADKNKKKRKRANKKKKKTDQPQEQQQPQPPSTNKNVKDTKPKEVKPVAGTEEKNITQSKTEKKTTEKSAPTTTTATNKEENVNVISDTKNETKEKTEPVARVTDKTASASTTQKPQPEEQPRAKEQAQESKKEKEKEKAQTTEDSPKKVVKDTNTDKSKIQAKEETKTETVGEGEEEANEPLTAKQAREAKKNKKVFKKKLNFDPHDPREHITLVAIGHVDAGKSTTSGQILLSTGQIDQRLIEKYQKEAKERGRDGWWVAYITDQDEEEKARGKTVDCARVQFETKDKRFTLLDAPGHNNYVPNMISGTALADVAILVVSARSGEFEAGFKRGGQTREHSLLTLTLGVPRVIVAINKMDFCEWKQERYETVKKEIGTFLKEIGFKEKALDFLPIASLSGANFKTPLTPDVCPWYKGECLLDLLNNMKKIKRFPDDPLCIPVLARYKGDNGLTVIAKVETGIVSIGDTVLVMPCNQTATVINLFIDEVAVQAAASGENILLCLDARSKVTLDNLIEGSVICAVDNPCPISRTFRAEAFLMELPTDSVLTVGYSAMLHIHNIAVECEIISMPHKLHPKTRKRSKVPPKMLRIKESAIMDIQVKSDPIPLETFEKLPKLGRFALRDQGLTTVIGRVLEILPNK